MFPFYNRCSHSPCFHCYGDPSTWPESNRGSSWMQMQILLKLCTCIWNLKTIPVNNEDTHLSTHKKTFCFMWDSMFMLYVRLNWKLLCVLIELIRSLSSDVFERHTLTGSEPFSLLKCQNATKFVLLSFLTLIETIWPKKIVQNRG